MDSNDPQYINLHHVPIKVEDTTEEEQKPAAVAVVHDDDSTLGSINSYVALDRQHTRAPMQPTSTDARSNSGTYHTTRSGNAEETSDIDMEEAARNLAHLHAEVSATNDASAHMERSSRTLPPITFYWSLNTYVALFSFKFLTSVSSADA